MAENIHDKFFKDNFSKKDIALAFIHETFPEGLSEKLDVETFTLSNNSYVDTTLEEHFADIVYTCQFKGQQPVEIAIVFEHKSYKENYPHFQLLRYLLNSWELARKQKRPPTLMIPVIIYHGKSRWRYKSLPGYFGKVDADLLRFLPAFEYLLFDISHYPDEKLLAFRNKFLATSLFLMKNREDEKRLLAQKGQLFVWLEDFPETETGANYLEATIVYLSKNLELRPKDFFQQLFTTKQNQHKAMTTYDQILKEGIEVGIERGIEVGIEKGIERGIEKGIERGLEKGKLVALISLLKVAYQQGIDIDRLAIQYQDLPAIDVQTIVEQIKKGAL